MNHWRFVGVVGVVLLAGSLSAQDGPQKGVIKKVDADKSTLTITADGKDVVVKVTADTRVMDAGKQVEEPFKNKVFKPGAAVMFFAKDDMLVGIRIGEGKGDKRPGGGIQEGKIAAIDLDKLTITFKTGNTSVEAIATDDTNFFEVKGDDIKARLKMLKVGADVNYLIQQKDGKNVLAGVRPLPAGVGKKDAGKKPPPFEKVDSSKLVPINELGNKAYKDGHHGGFYPDGKNVRPKDHEAAGLRLAKDLQPRDAAGKPDKNGKIVLLSVGMSNTSQASQGFERVLKNADGINPQFQFVNGAQGGMTAARIQDPNNADGGKYWGEVDRRLKAAGVTRDQVQVIWIKQADAGPRSGWPTYAKTLEEELARIVQLFPKRFPNAKLVYLSSRTYGGYANGPLNPEPYAYESAFSVKWLIERQLKGEAALNYDPAKGNVKAPWLSWGPYLWANGEKKNPDGLSYTRDDFSDDGTHHSPAGSEKIGRHMLQFFRSDTVARSWFLAN